MHLNGLTIRLIACLGFVLVTSCGTKAPAMPPSSSIQLSQAVRDQRVFDCATLKPERLPATSQLFIDTLPPKLEGETDPGYRERLSANEKGLFDWLQWSIRQSARWRGYCET